MEIDIFPTPHQKEGIARNFDKGFLGILIITYIIAAFKTAQCIVGNDAGKEFECFLLTIPIFVGYYALFVLVCHGIKTGLYAYFKSHRKEWNSIADREEMEEHIAQNLGHLSIPMLVYHNYHNYISLSFTRVCKCRIHNSV